MESITDDLIKAIKEKTSPGSAAAVLSDILLLNSEAIYRRLRGQVPFTLDEAIRVCRELNISLDLLGGIKNSSRFAFHLDTYQSEDPLMEYSDMLSRITHTMKSLYKDPTARSYRAHKSIPQEFLYHYEMLSRVFVYVLYYQLYAQNPGVKKMAEFELPKNMFRSQKEAATCMHNHESMIILDRDIIKGFVDIVRFFLDLKMINPEEVKIIKKELHCLLDDLENCADTGKSLNGKHMDIYLSCISFDSNYDCLESADICVGSLGVYYADYLSCTSNVVFNVHKSWILSLRKFSKLISVADELSRRSFLSQQRELVDTML